MKLAHLFEAREAIWEGDTCKSTVGNIPVELSVTIVEGKSNIFMKGASTLIKNPTALAVGALWAADSLRKYEKNKRNTTRFFAKSHEERTLYDKIVKDLMATGHYKMVRTKFVDGGKLWELKRNV